MIRHLEIASTISGLASCLHFGISAASRRTPLIALILTVAACLCIAPTQAALINHGDYDGNTVQFLMVREAANSAGDVAPLFGAPTVAADSLAFSPVGFSASTTGGGVDITDGNLAFMVKAKAGNAIQNVHIQEFGDTTLSGLGGDTTFSSVTMHGVLDISEVDFAGINKISMPITITNFSPSGGTYGLGTDGGGGPLFSSGWMGSTLVDLTTSNPVVAAAFAARNIVPSLGVTKVSVNFNNTLVAISQPGTTALIAKKSSNGIIITTNIPEPTSCLLAALTLAMCGMVSRRVR